MRIAFVGKGGSGKTTLSSLFIKYCAEHNNPVVGIDADINQHLATTLGLSPSPQSLGQEQQHIKKLCAGSNPLVNPKQMIKTTPPGKGSRIFKGAEDLINSLDSFVSSKDNISVLRVGTQTEEDTGIRCYHNKTGAVELILNHLVDGKNEYLITDMTAGADAFASGLFDKFDLTIVVVEPTFKSLTVFNQYHDEAKKYGVQVQAVGNKVISEEDKEFLQSQLGTSLLGCMPLSAEIRKSEQEGFLDNISDPETRQVLELIKKSIDSQIKDWDSYLEKTHEFHRLNSQSWANFSYGTNLELQIDTEFKYPV